MHLVSAHIILDTYATVLAPTLWIQVAFDIVTALIAVMFLTLRKSYGIVIDGPNALIEAKDKLKIKNEQLQALYHILSAADDTLNLDKMTKNVLLKTSEVLGIKGGAIYLLDKDRKDTGNAVLRLSARMNTDNSLVFPKEIPLTSITGTFTTSFSFSRHGNVGLANVFLNVIKSGKIFLAQNKSEIQRKNISIPDSESLIIVPLRKNQLVGLFLLFDTKPRTFIKEEIAFLEAIGSQIGNSIEKATLYMNALESKHQAELLSDLQKDFINIASHEMRTPV
ncbi:MAG: GAF domain-containing protein [Thermoproteota archaeon]|nr:GAF domain-containing protein [Thermoproteota archaeon]